MKTARSFAAIVMWNAVVLLNAQEVAPNERRLRFGVNVLPGMAFRELTVTEKSETAEAIVELRDDIEEPRFAYGANLVCALDLSKRFAVEGGFGYSLMGYRFRRDDLTFGDLIDPDRGFVYQTTDKAFAAVELRYDFHYLEMPLRMVLHCGKGRLRSITGIGITTSYLFRSGSTSVYEYTDGTKDRSTSESAYDFRTIGFFPTLSTGAAYTINDHLELRLEASVRYGVSRIIDGPITAHLWSAGLNFGIMWRL